MGNNESLMKCGFSKDNNNQELIKVFSNNAKLNEVHIDVYSSDPFDTRYPILILRALEKNVAVINDTDTLTLVKNGSFYTQIMCIVLNNITECFVKSYINCLSFIINYQNIYYKITIFK